LPLSEKTRIEVYVPDLPDPAYRALLRALDREFTYTFGGATTLRGLDGSYLSDAGETIADKVSIIFTDTPLNLDLASEALAAYGDALQRAAFGVLREEAVLVTAMRVFHAV
jgi:hypothetical protein